MMTKRQSPPMLMMNMVVVDDGDSEATAADVYNEYGCC